MENLCNFFFFKHWINETGHFTGYILPLGSHFETHNLHISRFVFFFLLVILTSLSLKIVFTFYRCRNWDSERLDNLPKVRSWTKQHLNPVPLWLQSQCRFLPFCPYLHCCVLGRFLRLSCMLLPFPLSLRNACLFIHISSYVAENLTYGQRGENFCGANDFSPFVCILHVSCLL